MSEARVTLVAGMQVTPTVHLLAPLGAGGMGAVWVADHTGLKTRVVVKFMLAELDASVSARTRFSREAAAAAQVKSPHVVQMLDHGVTDDGVPFIVMEHLEGRDLAAVLSERGALPATEVVTIVAQIAKALGKVHAAGLLHRDIKPDNVFLCGTDGDDEIFVKLLDFGIAKKKSAEEEPPSDSETKTGQVVGTPYYMSPEQVTAQKEIDFRSDLWALGVLTFEALTGTRPFDGPSFGALAVKIATGEVPRPSELNPSLPESVDAWFARACARQPKDRFGSARELAEALRASFDGHVTLASPMSDSGDGPRAVPPRVVSSAGAATAEAASRPSFVLASTVNEGASLSVPSSRGDGERRKGSGVSLPAIGFGALVLGAALSALGYMVFRTPETQAAKPTATVAASSALPPAASGLPSAAHVDTAPSSAVSATADASGTASGAASGVASAAPSATVVPVVHSGGVGGGHSPRTPHATPSASTAPKSSGTVAVPRPTSSHDDPLY